MKAHIVIAHPEPQSYNAHLAATARASLQALGWSVTVSDLNAMNFDPCERHTHYTPPLNRARFDVQAEQLHASQHATLPPDVAAQIARLSH
jgi:NAD(P)H dehydrogenase (quinone)